jgi:hypothetical protein
MTYAIKWGGDSPNSGGFVYFDAVLLITETHSGQISKHPIDSGASITDHYTKDNSKWTISAVISGIDISTGKYLIQDIDGNFAFNATQAPNPVSVQSTDNSILTKFIPDSIGQFLPDRSPETTMDAARADLLEQIKQGLINLTSGVIFNEETGQFDSNIELVQLYEFDGSLLKKIINNLVITNITFNENTDSGFALFCDISFEQVTFAYLKKVEIPRRVTQALTKKAESKTSLGKCDSTPKDPNSADNTDSQTKKDAVNDSDPLRTTQ